jgi:hypothetical protein
VLADELGPATVDVAVVRRPSPQVRLTLSWPLPEGEMPDVDVLLERDRAEDLAAVAGSAGSSGGALGMFNSSGRGDVPHGG